MQYLYDFGWQLPGRQVNPNSSRHGYNGMEKNNEIDGGSYDFGARMYDGRVCRFWSVDPKEKEFPYWSPYMFAANNPIRYIDVNGEGPGDPVDIYDITRAFRDGKTATKLRITVYVDQPGVGGDRDAWELGTGFGAFTPDVGHTFIKLSKVNTDGSVVERIVGFYPDGRVTPTFTKTKGVFKNDDGHKYDVQVAFDLTETGFTATLDYLNSLAGEKYDLNDFNCTDFGLGAAEASGNPLPDTQGKWGDVEIAGNYIEKGGGSNPGDLGEDLRTFTGGAVHAKTGATARARNVEPRPTEDTNKPERP